MVQHAQRKVLLEGHRKAFCWLDEWYGLTMEDIRAMEKETAEAMLRVRTKAAKCESFRSLVLLQDGPRSKTGCE